MLQFSAYGYHFIQLWDHIILKLSCFSFISKINGMMLNANVLILALSCMHRKLWSSTVICLLYFLIIWSVCPIILLTKKKKKEGKKGCVVLLIVFHLDFILFIWRVFRSFIKCSDENFHRFTKFFLVQFAIFIKRIDKFLGYILFRVIYINAPQCCAIVAICTLIF